MPATLSRPYYQVLNAKIAGATVASFLLVGRWSPERLLGIESPRYFELHWGMLLEPRQWVLGILLFTVLLLKFPRRREVSSHDKVTERYGRSAFRYLLLLFVYLICSATWAPEPTFAMLKAYDTLLTLGVLVVVGLWYKSTDAELFHRTFWQTLLGLTGVLVLCALASLTTGRLSVLGGGPNVFARLMFLFTAASLGLALRFRMLGLFFAVIGMSLVALSGSRGGMLAASCGGLTYLWVERAKVSSKLLVLGGGTLTAAVVFSLTPLGNRVYEVFYYRIVELTFQQGYTSDRDVLFEEALGVWRECPVLGTGISGWAAYQHATAVNISSHPHNLFGEMLCEGGVIAASLLLLAIWKFLRYAYRIRDCFHVPSMACAAMYFVASQFSGDFFDSRGIFVCAFLASFPYAYSSKAKVSSESQQRRRQTVVPRHNVRPMKLRPVTDQHSNDISNEQQVGEVA